MDKILITELACFLCLLSSFMSHCKALWVIKVKSSSGADLRLVARREEQRRSLSGHRGAAEGGPPVGRGPVGLGETPESNMEEGGPEPR